MADGTGIEWADSTWNPLIGCTRVSAGCDNCYAEGVVNRFAGTGDAWPARFDTVSIRPDRFLTQPLRWTKPRKVFVNSLSDLFHKDVPDTFIAKVFAVMAATPQHTYQLLTKRHGRMRSLLSSDQWDDLYDLALRDLMMHGHVSDGSCSDAPLMQDGPLPNVWLGVSVEDQKHADLRIPALLDTPAAVRWISAEPLLGPVDLDRWLSPQGDCPTCAGCGSVDVPGGGAACPTCNYDRRHLEPSLLDWVVVGGESGARARPMHPNWARALRDQCAAADVPYLFKQYGNWAPAADKPAHGDVWVFGGGIGSQAWEPGQKGDPSPGRWSEHGDALMRNVGKKAAGRELDGRTHDGYPDARTRV